MGIKLNGLTAALSTFREVDRRYNAAVAAEIERGAKEIAALARDFAPIDKGALVRSIRAQRVAGARATAWRVKVTNNLDYAVLVHETFVTTRGEKTDARPKPRNPGKKSRNKARRLGVAVGGKFLTRAFMAKRAEIEKRIREAIRKETNDIAKKRGGRKK